MYFYLCFIFLFLQWSIILSNFFQFDHFCYPLALHGIWITTVLFPCWFPTFILSFCRAFSGFFYSVLPANHLHKLLSSLSLALQSVVLRPMPFLLLSSDSIICLVAYMASFLPSSFGCCHHHASSQLFPSSLHDHSFALYLLWYFFYNFVGITPDHLHATLLVAF